MEDEISILVQHGGKWDNEHNFNNFVVDGVTLKVGCDLETILEEITKILGVYATMDTVEIKYSVKHNYTPMKIYNDRSLNWYLNLKSKSSFTDYPLCITLKEKDCDLFLSNLNPVSSSSNGMQDMQLVESVEHIETFMPNDGDYCDVLKIAEDGIISEKFHREVKKGQLYKNKIIFQEVISLFAIKENFQFRVNRSSKSRYYLVCIDEQCSWNLRSSSLNESDIFKVRKFYNVHTCGNDSRFFAQKHATSKLVGGLITDNVDDPKLEYTPADIQRDIRKNYGVELNYMKAWRAKGKALEILRGKPRDSYSKMPKYLYMVKHTNPGSVTSLKKLEDGRFLYAYVALYASIKGWEYCRPVVVVDGSFLKATYRGTILTACTQDAGGKIVPLAFAVVDSENDASWKWFFEQIRETYGTREDKEARDLPIYELMDFLMRMIGRWNNTNRNEAIRTGTTLSTKYEIMLKDKMKESLRMTVTQSTEYLYTVYDGAKRYVVCMRERICTCRQFQMDVMPCMHALAIVRKYYMSEYEYCSVYYKKDYLLNTYEVPVYPIPDESIWQIPPNVLADVVLPPKGNIKPGRPQKKRYKDCGESKPKKSKITCSVCGQPDHNKQTCRNIPKED